MSTHNQPAAYPLLIYQHLHQPESYTPIMIQGNNSVIATDPM